MANRSKESLKMDAIDHLTRPSFYGVWLGIAALGSFGAALLGVMRMFDITHSGEDDFVMMCALFVLSISAPLALSSFIGSVLLARVKRLEKQYDRQQMSAHLEREVDTATGSEEDRGR